MPPEWEEDAWQNKNGFTAFDGQETKNPTLRPPLYNAEDYTAALKQLFSLNHALRHQMPNLSPTSVLIEHSSNGPIAGAGLAEMTPISQPEMGMKKFLNGSELLFKLEADLRHGYPSFVQEFVSGQYEGVGCILEALKTIQAALADVSGLREQRKLLMDEQKCLQCVKLSLRNIEAVSKLASYPGGLYPLAAAMVSTATTTRIIALEILTCVCTEGGPDGHYKVSEALSTLRLRVGEPMRCKLIVGAISSAPPGTFQAKGIRFLTSFIASAPSPKHKVYIQCELEEAGYNAAVLRKGAELGGARESREVQVELDEWDRVIIDVDTLTRQNCQLRNSVATLQQELATLKDKLKRMDVPQKPSEETRKRSSRCKRSEEAMISTPVDSEEEAEQIHQILEDLNNIVNSEMHIQKKEKREKEIVPVNLVKSPPKKKLSSSTPVLPRPWPGSSASDDDDSDIVEMLEDSNNGRPHKSSKPNVLRVVQQLENMDHRPAPKHFRDKHQKLQNLPISMAKSLSPIQGRSPTTDHKAENNLPNFHKANHMASKFANFKSSKLYSSSPDNSGGDSQSSSKNNPSSGYAELFDKSTQGSRNSDRSINNNHRLNISPRLSPNLNHSDHSADYPKKKRESKQHNNQAQPGQSSSSGLRRSESLHASLASIETATSSTDNKVFQAELLLNRGRGPGGKSQTSGVQRSDKWKSMEHLEKGSDENFTLKWRYPNPNQANGSSPSARRPQPESMNNLTLTSASPSPKGGSKSAKLVAKSAMNSRGNNSKSSSQQQHQLPSGQREHLTSGELSMDYRQNRFIKNFKGPSPNGMEQQRESSASGGGSSSLNIFARYSKKFPSKEKSSSKQQAPSAPHDFHINKKGGSSSSQHHHQAEFNSKENDQSMKMFSLPPILMPHAIDNHRLTDLPSGLY